MWAGTGSLLQECIESTKQFSEILFLGEVENVEELYSATDLYFQPSLLESHGISVLGAMYHKIPCIVSDQGGLPESIFNNFNGYTINLENIKVVV
jgi:glycosyltransferase involved in cell wall biosynthesis